jgi:hypothetical protein
MRIIIRVKKIKIHNLLTKQIIDEVSEKNISLNLV